MRERKAKKGKKRCCQYWELSNWLFSVALLGLAAFWFCFGRRYSTYPPSIQSECLRATDLYYLFCLLSIPIEYEMYMVIYLLTYLFIYISNSMSSTSQ